MKVRGHSCGKNRVWCELSSTSPPPGNQVDGLPGVASFSIFRVHSGSVLEFPLLVLNRDLKKLSKITLRIFLDQYDVCVIPLAREIHNLLKFRFFKDENMTILSHFEEFFRMQSSLSACCCDCRDMKRC